MQNGIIMLCVVGNPYTETGGNVLLGIAEYTTSPQEQLASAQITRRALDMGMIIDNHGAGAPSNHPRVTLHASCIVVTFIRSKRFSVVFFSR